jgi:hypothetical protein
MRHQMNLPTPKTVRAYRRLAWFGLGVAFFAITTAVAAISTGRGGGFDRSPVSVLLLGIGYAAVVVTWLGTANRLARQVRRLASHGRRYAVERVETKRIQRGFVSGWIVVVARWRDGKGIAREALSEGFDYDPHALLEATRVEVVADAFDPGLCLVASDTLPPHEWRDLDGARRAQVDRHTPTPFGMQSVPVWVPIALVLLVLGMLAWMAR